VAGARIRVQRTGSLRSDWFRGYTVILDGETIGRIGRGEELVREAGTGRHELKLAIDWASSRPVEFELTDGQEVLIRCWPAVNPLRALRYMTVGRRQWIGVELVEGEATDIVRDR
jgi:hypothetical protein